MFVDANLMLFIFLGVRVLDQPVVVDRDWPTWAISRYHDINGVVVIPVIVGDLFSFSFFFFNCHTRRFEKLSFFFFLNWIIQELKTEQ